MAELTATVITYNEEDNIRECLESLAWVKEIVIDRKSTRLNSSHIQKSRMPSSA